MGVDVMESAKGTQAYQINDVATSTQVRLILMMYDGAIRFINMAMEAMDRNDIARKGKYIQKSRDVINELMVALDTDRGGEVTRNLERLYQFALRQLTLANIKNDREALGSVLRVLTPLREGWEQAFPTTDNQAENSGDAPPPTRFAARC